MAKATKINAFFTTFANIFWCVRRNWSRDAVSPAAKLAELTRSLSGGWWGENMVPVEKIDKINSMDGTDYTAECVKLRQEQWDAFKADKSADGALKLRTFEELFTKNGKVIAPEYIANAMYQRASTYLDSQILRVKEKLDVLDQIPCRLEAYADQMERLADQVRENVGKDVGKESMSNTGKLRTALMFYQNGKAQKFLRELYTDTTGQKLFHLCNLNRLYPNLKIVDRTLKTPQYDDEGRVINDAILYPKPNVKDLTAFSRRSVSSELKVTNGVKETLTNEAEVGAYFNNVNGTGGNDPKIMSKDNIKALADQHQCAVVRDAAQAVFSNNNDFVAKYVPISAGMNVLVEMAARNCYPPLEVVLIGVYEHMKANPQANVFAVIRDIADSHITEPAATSQPNS